MRWSCVGTADVSTLRLCCPTVDTRYADVRMHNYTGAQEGLFPIRYQVGGTLQGNLGSMYYLGELLNYRYLGCLQVVWSMPGMTDGASHAQVGCMINFLSPRSSCTEDDTQSSKAINPRILGAHPNLHPWFVEGLSLVFVCDMICCFSLAYNTTVLVTSLSQESTVSCG